MLNFTSNSKAFIDFGASAASAASPIAQPGGAIWLQAVSNVEEDDEGSVETKPAMGVSGAAGFITKEGGKKLTVTEYRQTKPQVKWRALKKAKTLFMFMVQDENGGPRQKWFPCRVSKVTRGSDAEGKHEDKIEIVALDGLESA